MLRHGLSQVERIARYNLTIRAPVASWAVPTMTPFFTRLTFAIRTFFAILFRDHVPHDVTAALMTTSGRASETAGAGAPVSAPAAAAGAPAPVVKAAMPPDGDATATQLLALLQRDGRLIDFLMEDITPYADAQIGAAVRSVHAGCRQALERYVSLAPALDAEEGTRVTVDRGSDAARVKLIGNVPGEPPFTGVLHHRGWVVDRMELPPLAAAGRQVIAPAEIEVA
jgi:Domain of unknown function (DUF2760)